LGSPKAPRWERREKEGIQQLEIRFMFVGGGRKGRRAPGSPAQLLLSLGFSVLEKRGKKEKKSGGKQLVPRPDLVTFLKSIPLW